MVRARRMRRKASSPQFQPAYGIRVGCSLTVAPGVGAMISTAGQGYGLARLPPSQLDSAQVVRGIRVGCSLTVVPAVGARMVRARRMRRRASSLPFQPVHLIRVGCSLTVAPGVGGAMVRARRMRPLIASLPVRCRGNCRIRHRKRTPAIPLHFLRSLLGPHIPVGAGSMAPSPAGVGTITVKPMCQRADSRQSAAGA